MKQAKPTSKVVSTDVFTGIKETFWTDADGNLQINREQDCDSILDANQLFREHKNSYAGEGFHKVASIPHIIWEKWAKELKEQGRNPDPAAEENKEWLIARLNDPDWARLKAKDGRI